LSKPKATIAAEPRGWMRRLDRWLNALPHPAAVVEIAPSHVAAARWGASRDRVECSELEPIGARALAPSPVEPNILDADAIRTPLQRAFRRVPVAGHSVALLVPDPVVRVFILPFEELPRRADDALPLLRWRLKKSVPFDVEETVVSWMRQAGRQGNLEIVAAVARQRIVREYQELIESQGANVPVVLSSTLATLPLLDESGAELLVRMCGRTLTTVIVRGPNLCVYRSSEMAAGGAALDPKVMLDEIFPAIAYYQDTWGGMVDGARIAGFGEREDAFRGALAAELGIAVGGIADDAGKSRQLPPAAKGLIRQNMDALAGWMMNAGA